jgi:hypothetical protein
MKPPGASSMKHKIFLCTAVLFVTTLMSSQFGSSHASTKAVLMASYECVGNACEVTTLTWHNDRQQFKVENSSGQEVKATVNNFAGASSVIVQPHKENYLEVKTFNGPYIANYVE